jgi:iron uptake system component EfeO
VRSLPRPALVLPLGLLVALAGCGTPSSEASADGVRTVTITMTDDACTAEPSSVPAGATTFAVRNTSAARVTEAEVLQDGRILGEKENLTPGLSGSFTLRLTAGAYVLACPNAATERSAFTVTAAAGSSTGSPAAERDLTKAVTAYQAYLVEQTTTLTASTRTFVAAVKAGQVDRARALYPRTRAPYERIEPVAESFGELDPRIDARENDVDPGTPWTGFHRVEQALWAGGDRATTFTPTQAAQIGPVADQLLADVLDLQQRVRSVTLTPEQIAGGAVGLMDEVARSKISGEEERYSRTDLWDFAANLAGARQALDVLRPALRTDHADLLARIDAQLADVQASLATYRTRAGYQDYTVVTDAERRTLTTQVNALAESLSQVAPLVAAS